MSGSLEGKPGPLSPFVGRVVLPGDEILDLTSARRVVRLGGGLRQDEDRVVAMRSGLLQSTRKGTLWIETSLKRYMPADGDCVIGFVVDKHSESFDVDIGGPAKAVLPALAFEGATRRNRPNLEVGAALYARVVKVHPDMDPELACTDAGGQAAGFGPLTGGYIFDCTSGLARGLLSSPTFPVLAALGESLAFEMAVGLNGRVWITSAQSADTVLVSAAIQNAEYLSAIQQRAMVKRMLRKAH